MTRFHFIFLLLRQFLNFSLVIYLLRTFYSFLNSLLFLKHLLVLILVFVDWFELVVIVGSALLGGGEAGLEVS